MRTLSSNVAAWPCSSKAMTTTAAPKRMHNLACRKNSSSPTFREMEFTMHLPCTHFKPSSITGHLDESIMNGNLATFGSVTHKRMNLPIAVLPSIKSESKLKSRMSALFSHCARHTSIASSHLFASTSFLNFGDPIKLHRSPTHWNPISGFTKHGSKPDNCMLGYSGSTGSTRGGQFFTFSATAAMCEGKVPQHPPTKLRSPSFA
mmetsp:Transcript_134954/g.288705  ORF Transcript_134954/g.288705 Transcript_134954/m.288705 type:complete len:205 (+) Transcript_134954:2360-2974(+)